MKESINNTKLHAILHYVTPPSDKQKKGILDFLEKKYGPSELELVTDLSLKGGFILYDFAFTFFCGVVIGTYASNFIASGLLILFMKTKKA